MHALVPPVTHPHRRTPRHIARTEPPPPPAAPQFLDHIRRGTSIGLGDLAGDPPPASLADAYRLMCLTRVDAEGLSNAIRTLQEESAAARNRVAEREAQLGAENPAVFRDLQLTRGAELDRLR